MDADVADYNADKADGKVNWGQQAKDAAKDWKVSSVAAVTTYVSAIADFKLAAVWLSLVTG